jgi:hypothetical protein
VKLRLHGTTAALAQVTRCLVEVLDVVSVSDPYPDRVPRPLARVYSRSAWTTGSMTWTTGR